MKLYLIVSYGRMLGKQRRREKYRYSTECDKQRDSVENEEKKSNGTAQYNTKKYIEEFFSCSADFDCYVGVVSGNCWNTD